MKSFIGSMSAVLAGYVVEWTHRGRETSADYKVL